MSAEGYCRYQSSCAEERIDSQRHAYRSYYRECDGCQSPESTGNEGKKSYSHEDECGEQLRCYGCLKYSGYVLIESKGLIDTDQHVSKKDYDDDREHV